MDGRQCVGLDCPSSCSTHIQLDGKLGRSKGKTSSGRGLASATSYNSVSSKSLVILSNVLPLQSPQTPMAREEACRGARRRQQCSKCRSGKRHGVLMHGDVDCQRVESFTVTSARKCRCHCRVLNSGTCVEFGLSGIFFACSPVSEQLAHGRSSHSHFGQHRTEASRKHC